MLSINDLKNGTIFEKDGQLWQVLEYQHSKMGRGGAVLKTKLKNLITGATLTNTFQGSDKFGEARLERKKAQYLYKEGAHFVFMDESSYDQFHLDKNMVGESLNYIKEGDTVELQYHKENPINLDVPIKVSLKVTEAMEADKGNTATAATKPITLETGLIIQAPMFIKEGDVVVVDTRTATYVERAT